MLKPLLTAGEVRGIDGLHADEDPFAAGGRDEVHEFGVAQKIGADLGDPMDLGAGADDVAQKRFGAFDVDGEIIVDEEDGNLAAFASRAGFQQEQFIHDAFVSAKADGIAKEAGHRAELAAIGAAASRLDGNDAKCAPAFTDALEGALGPAWESD